MAFSFEKILSNRTGQILISIILGLCGLDLCGLDFKVGYLLSNLSTPILAQQFEIPTIKYSNLVSWLVGGSN